MNEFANEIAFADELAASDSCGCRNCAGGGWVCENHADRPWDGTSSDEMACGCGAGMPCGVCNLEAAAAGYVFRERDAIIAYLRSHEGLGDRGKWLIVAAGEIEASKHLTGESTA